MITKTLHNFREHARKIKDFSSMAGLLQWDQEVKMPAAAHNSRARQLAEISGFIHDLQTQPEFREWTEIIANSTEVSKTDRLNAQLMLEELNRICSLDRDFVVKLNRCIGETFHIWHQERSNRTHKAFDEQLARLVELKREEAEKLGYSGHPYNAMLNTYDRGLNCEQVENLLFPLTETLKNFISHSTNENQKPESIPGPISAALQEQFGRLLLEHMGYDFSKGRMDPAPHPFCIGLDALDVRVTYHVSESDPDQIIWSLLHEGGHALYEQGLSPEGTGLASGSANSLTIHESQSRLWENHVGRSIPFWAGVHAEIVPHKIQFPLPDAQTIIKAANRVQPGLIRIQSDEVSYHFHIRIRYEVEKALMTGEIQTSDIETFWNDAYEHWLGIRPENPAEGYMQDIHWAHGSFGYFPTYSLGSLLAAQLFEAARKAVSWNDELVTSNHLKELKNWLHTNVHRYGGLKTAAEICQDATGKPLDINPYLTHIRNTYGL